MWRKWKVWIPKEPKNTEKYHISHTWKKMEREKRFMYIWKQEGWKKHSSSHQNHCWETRFECYLEFSSLNFNIRKPWITSIHLSAPQCDLVSTLWGELSNLTYKYPHTKARNPSFSLSVSRTNIQSLVSCIFCRRSSVSFVHSTNIY